MPRILITETDVKPQPYKVKLERELITIGRAANNDIVLTDASTSTYHCELKRVEGGYILIDKDSTNGVKKNGTRYSKIDLNDDTDFELGDVEVEFEYSEEEVETLEEEDEFVSEEKLALPKSSKKKKKSVSKNYKKDSEETNKNKSKDEDEDEEDDDDDDWDDLEDWDEDEEEDTKKQKKSSSSDSRKPAKQVKLATPVVTLNLILLCILGFLGALTIKHYLAHGSFIVTDLISKRELPPEEKEDSE